MRLLLVEGSEATGGLVLGTLGGQYLVRLCSVCGGGNCCRGSVGRM